MKFNKIKNQFIDFFISFRQYTAIISRVSLFYLSVLGFMVVIYEVGFLSKSTISKSYFDFYNILIFIYSIFLLIRLQSRKLKKFRISVYLIELIIFLVMILFSVNNLFSGFWFSEHLLSLNRFDNKTFLHFIISLIFIIELSKNTVNFYRLNINPALLFVFSFILLILVGTGFLLLPNSTTSPISLVDALFTSASAVCVTGLTAVDTAAKFTFMGKTIIMLLIQTGGLGIMTFTSLFGLFFAGNLTFQNQLFLKDYINSENVGEVFKVLFQITFITIAIELAGAAFLFFSIDSPQVVSIGQKLFFSIFHSISAYCNAGFSTLSDNMYNPYIRFNYTIQLTIAFLIILGGIGFPIILNYYKLIKIKIKNQLYPIFKIKKAEHIPRIISINTKIVVRTTILLLIFGTIFFFILEYNNTLNEHSLWGKIIVSFFNSVTPRTAGFNNVDMGILLKPTILIIIFLMWIGASPASTGGGIKTSTFTVAVLNIFSLARGKNRTEYFRREIPTESIKRSYAVILLSLLVVGSSVFIMSCIETNKSLLSICFETFSAFGTVGLSLGITPFLTDYSKVLLVIVMFMGRVGTLTIMVGILRKVVTVRYHYPTENIFIN